MEKYTIGCHTFLDMRNIRASYLSYINNHPFFEKRDSILRYAYVDHSRPGHLSISNQLRFLFQNLSRKVCCLFIKFLKWLRGLSIHAVHFIAKEYRIWTCFTKFLRSCDSCLWTERIPLHAKYAFPLVISDGQKIALSFIAYLLNILTIVFRAPALFHLLINGLAELL